MVKVGLLHGPIGQTHFNARGAEAVPWTRRWGLALAVL